MIGQPGVLSGVRVHRDHFGHQRASVCSFGTSSVMKELPSGRGTQVAERDGCPLSFTATIRFCFMLSDSEMSRCVLISPLWRPIVKVRISGFDYMIGQPGVLSGVRVHRDHFGHQRASVCSFGDQLGHEGVALRGGQVAEREGCPLSFTDTIRFCFMLSDSEMSRCVLISPLWRPIDSQAFCPESASTAITLDTREPPCAALGTSSVIKELRSGEGLRNVPLCPDLSAVETNSEKSRISGFDYMIRQPGVLSGVASTAITLDTREPPCAALGTSSSASTAITLDTREPPCAALVKVRISGFDYMIDSQAFCPESASTAITLDTREPPCAALGTSSQVAEREGCPLSFTDTIRFCFMLSDSEMSRCVLISPLWRPI
ncbi:hypothetical protein F7725_010140 [Dissostichus mawsoni]|uniref:Uncharacterized protein n=1 Tax=Dissostichus mawsoni TaxID=36200 RepID=A0A7J5XMS0_DISMA|nr:hypothetical protein F7725_010140 [Dissostichus mawsoni]